LSMRLWYRDYHETGLCCYLVVHIENLLHPLQLFYLNLWPVYWLRLVCFRMMWWMVNRNGELFEMKSWWDNLKWYPRVCLDWLRKSKKYLDRKSWHPS
jgi:hypothetical protein